ncbi:phage antirepressor [Robertmurraya siralis]|uniref:phage antirepressor n=1 Tax=Robertmurraya siralis TaxID=77777 RepID=UPI0010F67888|nr:phage antirepressor [Robertmurraya siralis]
MDQLKIFNFKRSEVRTVLRDGEPWFVAKDVCRVLEIEKHRDAVSRLDEDERESVLVDTLGGSQQVTAINEPGLYSLVLRSRKPEAKEFKRWITHEVIPTIRKTGGYVEQNRAIDFVNSWLPLIDDTSKLAIASALEQNRELLIQNKELTKTLENQKPKVVLAEAIEVSSNSILVKDLAAILKQKGVDMGQNRLFIWLRENGYLCKKKGNMFNKPTQRSLNLGLFEVKEHVHTGNNGELKTTFTPKVTGKGQLYFINEFLSDVKKDDKALTY